MANASAIWQQAVIPPIDYHLLAAQKSHAKRPNSMRERERDRDRDRDRETETDRETARRSDRIRINNLGRVTVMAMCQHREILPLCACKHSL